MARPAKYRVRALPARGFYRLGRFWPHEGVEVELNAADAEALAAEPMLAVERVTAARSKKAAADEDTEG